ncbi:MAG TPA: hypothetical protein VFS75_03155 [Candidatus Paceibacterota bacterium]|nr:hypothetical protein [Candidatus Paceibacterota bacterium]
MTKPHLSVIPGGRYDEDPIHADGFISPEHNKLVDGSRYSVIWSMVRGDLDVHAFDTFYRAMEKGLDRKFPSVTIVHKPIDGDAGGMQIYLSVVVREEISMESFGELLSLFRGALSTAGIIRRPILCPIPPEP